MFGDDEKGPQVPPPPAPATKPPQAKPVVTVVRQDDSLPTEHRLAARLKRLVGCAQNIYIGGPPGSGKTTAASKAAEAAGRKLFVLPPVKDDFQVTGYVMPSGILLETEVYHWATTEGAYLLIDEVDAGLPGSLLALNMVLAQGWFLVPGHGRIQVPASNRVISTANTWGAGPDSEFVGRNKLDPAFLDRFPAKLMWDYDRKFERYLAALAAPLPIADVAATQMHMMRDNSIKYGIKQVISPRAINAHAQRMAAGFTPAESLDCSFLATLKPDVRAKLMEGIKV